MTQGAGDPDTDTPAQTATSSPPEPDDRDQPYEAKHSAKAKPPSTTRSLVEWALVIGGALLVALVIRAFLFTTFWIPSESMEPTLMGHKTVQETVLDANGQPVIGADGKAKVRTVKKAEHDRIIVNRLSYRLHAVNRGDIVVFTTPPSESPVTEDGQKVKDLIKRVVGLGGETVTLKDDHVYIDGKLLKEPYLPAGTATVAICPLGATFEIPEDSVLVMGDNRGNSTDGRCFGPIKKSTIVGRAFVRFWPFSKFTWL